MYIHKHPEWPNLRYRADELLRYVSDIRLLQGELLSKLSQLGFEVKNKALVEAMSLEIVKSNAIEGEMLDRDDVRSSIANRLGWSEGIKSSDRYVEGMVDMMMDATQNANQELTKDRLFSWHAAMFPTGYSGMYKIAVGSYRNNPEDPHMYVTSGSMKRPKIHFEAPTDDRIKGEMDQFLNWFNHEKTEPIIKSGIAHFWFVTIHPFDDGNGRIARAISEMQLSRSDGSDFRYFSMSDEIEKNKKGYYQILEKTQKGDVDITEWLKWYCEHVHKSLITSKERLNHIILKSEFWIEHKEVAFNARQRQVINRLFNGFEGKLTNSKYAKLSKTSSDTALRDINDLVDKGVLKRGAAGGRSSYYYLKKLGDKYEKD
ncbi:MAG: Fic family protein [Ekhidna sp.]